MRLREDVAVPVGDGVMLAARAWMPEVNHQVPAVVSLQPYQKDGRSRVHLPDAMHRFLARRGFASLLVDIRGTGGSPGAGGPFGPQEAEDGYRLVEWVASQPWCNGRVGMWGVSYPGITSLATAALNPPSLRAIAPVFACGDPDRDFVRVGGHEGGYWFGAEWGPRMMAYNLMPPLLRDRRGEWETTWLTRLRDSYPWVFSGYDGPDVDGRSVASPRPIDIGNITCASLHVAGWRDLFTGPALRDWAECQGPSRLIVGPWKHSFPDTDPWSPTPIADEIAGWFHRWLIDDGNLEGDVVELPVAFYVQSHADGSDIEGWYGSHTFPPSGSNTMNWRASIGSGLEPKDHARSSGGPLIEVPTTVSVGASSVVWDGWTAALDTSRAWDQRHEDNRSIMLTSEVLSSGLVLTGAPELAADLVSKGTAFFLSARLVEVLPDGRSVLITRGSISGKNEGSRPLTVVVSLDPTAYVVSPGSKLALAISTSDFPTVWPLDARRDSVFVDLSTVLLRLSVISPTDLNAHIFSGEGRAEDLADVVGTSVDSSWKVVRDLSKDTLALDVSSEEAFPLLGGGGCRIDNRYEIQASDAIGGENPRMRSRTRAEIEQADELVVVDVEVVTTMTEVTVTAKVERSGLPVLDAVWCKKRIGRSDEHTRS